MNSTTLKLVATLGLVVAFMVVYKISTAEDALAVPEELQTGRPVVLFYGGDW